MFQILKFLPLQQQLKLRLTCKFWTHVVSYSWKLQMIESQLAVELTLKRIELDFDEDTKIQHQDLLNTELCITSDLQKYLEDASKGDNLFSDIRQISYLPKPNHLIQKPLFAACVLVGKELPEPDNPNYNSKDELDKIWVKFRGQLKKKDFLKKFTSFDIRNIKKKNIAKVKKIYENDQWMTAQWIRRESIASLCLFLWTIKAIEYKAILDNLLTLGIRIHEDKIEDQKCLNFKMSGVYDHFLANYAE